MSIFTNAWVSKSAKILFRGETAPDPSKFRLCLANTATLARSSTLANFLAGELLPQNGYSRASATFTGDGSYDGTDQRHEMPTVSATFTADGGSLQFQTAFLMADAGAIASKSFTNSNVNPTTDTITISAHGFSDGDKLIFTADELATIPSGITTGTIYTVENTTTNTFEIGANITDTGSGTFRARSANGIIVAFETLDSPVTLAAGQTSTFQIPVVVLNSGYVAGT